MKNTRCPVLIHLRAINPARNVARDYWVIANPDLFGHVIVEQHWGRIGTRGQSRIRSFLTPALADRHIKGLLRRRASATKRIGVAYRAVQRGKSETFKTFAVPG